MHLDIFIIEDDPDYAELLHYQLRRLSGPRIRHFETGEQALAHLDEAPHLVWVKLQRVWAGGTRSRHRPTGSGYSRWRRPSLRW